jgi:hypothetical protein
MTTLIQFLETLNSSDTSCGVWVNPENVDDFRVGQFIFENGGIKDNWVCIGSLNSLSFGYQYEVDAFNEIIHTVMAPHKFNFEGLRAAFFNGEVHETLETQIQEAIDAYNAVQAHEAASHFINELPEIIAEELTSR